MDSLNFKYNTDDWGFFIDSSNVSLKAVFLQNRIELPSKALAQGIDMKESNQNMQSIFHYAKFVAT